MDYIIWVLYDFLIFGAIGMLIGQRKGRVLAGLVWSMLLGPFGWAIVALGPSMKNTGAKSCPHCGQPVAIGLNPCPHCGGKILWASGQPRKAMIVDPSLTGNNQQ